ncbi:transcription initiation protein SPT3 homolog [Condylostylus longicornis]|uniref:transcription initiation protein SPT3 homolog n=1 Tax=Condylostylus longicornis TaxID=2530218 RepID=UPI00244DE7B2|nr:transcription initiation protein SPT3 homolog [Condylostylus longicornis]
MSIRENNPVIRKIGRQNSNQNQIKQNTGTNATSNSLPSQNVNNGSEETNVSFLQEISDIMKGFGDCERPLRESVQLVEKILQQQLKGILSEATEVCLRRKRTTFPVQADFEFLMRRNPVKINRMRKHLKDMKTFRRILQLQYGRPQVLAEESDGQETDEDVEMEIPEKYDEEKTRRVFRADRISQILTGQQYQQYNEARRTSFYCRHSERMKLKFKQFLGIPQDSKIPGITLSILAYLAHETIAYIVDYAILTRLNSENRITEPYSRVTSSGNSYTMLHLCPEVVQGRGLEGVKPITVREIQEGMRRFNQIGRKTMGFYRNLTDPQKKNFLAI